MAILHKEYNSFDDKIKLTEARKKSLRGSRKAIRTRIREWFKTNKPNEIQPKFAGQGSFEMNTAINPIPKKDPDGNSRLHYDLDYGVYFLEDAGKDTRKTPATYHQWIVDAVNGHTETTTNKATCVRVEFADGHHIDLPIYYSNQHTGNNPFFELAHTSKGWKKSDAKAFYEWFNDKKKDNKQLERMVRYLKAWKNFRETANTNLKLPSGFELTILAVNNQVKDDNDDVAFRKTVAAMYKKLDDWFGFECLRPTTPKGEDLFSDYSSTRKSDFLTNLKALKEACEAADTELNMKKASEILQKQFGDRFPTGEDKTAQEKADDLKKQIGAAAIPPKPFRGR